MWELYIQVRWDIYRSPDINITPALCVFLITGVSWLLLLNTGAGR